MTTLKFNTSLIKIVFVTKRQGDGVLCRKKVDSNYPNVNIFFFFFSSPRISRIVFLDTKNRPKFSDLYASIYGNQFQLLSL
jgi:hypothetical protein